MKSLIVILATICFLAATASCGLAQEDGTTKILKSGLVGAGSGALAAGMSGGNAGKGALIGMGTSVIGGALLDMLSGNSGRQRRSRRDEYYDDEDDYYDEDGYYEERQQDPSHQIIKSGLVGAGTGAIAAGASGGKAGQGALIGAGTSVIGGALLNSITQPPKRRRVKKYKRETQKAPAEAPRSKVIRKYDENGNLIYEEIIPID